MDHIHIYIYVYINMYIYIKTYSFKVYSGMRAQVQGQLQSVEHISSSLGAFAALKTDGTVAPELRLPNGIMEVINDESSNSNDHGNRNKNHHIIIMNVLVRVIVVPRIRNSNHPSDSIKNNDIQVLVPDLEAQSPHQICTSTEYGSPEGYVGG